MSEENKDHQDELDDDKDLDLDDEELDDLDDDKDDEGKGDKDDDENIDWKAKALKAQGIAKRLAKKLKNKPQPSPDNKENNSQTNASDPDELRLIAKGLSDEEIEQARVIAKGKDISLLEAVKDDLFVTYQKNLKEEQKKAKAKLGNSNGSGQETKSGIKPGMTPEEHKEAWKESVGR